LLHAPIQLSPYGRIYRPFYSHPPKISGANSPNHMLTGREL
jgi:hypothetical protein